MPPQILYFLLSIHNMLLSFVSHFFKISHHFTKVPFKNLTEPKKVTFFKLIRMIAKVNRAFLS